MMRSLLAWVVFLASCAAPRSSPPAPPHSGSPEVAVDPAPTPLVPLPADAVTSRAVGPAGDVPPAHAEATAGEDDFAWLRGRAPGLDALRHGSLAVPELVEWVEEGRVVELWLIAGEHRCAPVFASRASPERLALEIVAAETGARGHRVRRVVAGHAGHLLTFGASGHSLRQNRAGEWVRNADEWARSGGEVAGALRLVDGERAWYDGEPVRLSVSCPWRPLPCASGGARSCRDCEQLQVHVHSIEGLHGAYAVVEARGDAATCSEPCPPAESGAMAQAERISRELQSVWRERAPSPVGLYRSQAGCRAALAAAREAAP